MIDWVSIVRHSHRRLSNSLTQARSPIRIRQLQLQRQRQRQRERERERESNRQDERECDHECRSSIGLNSAVVMALLSPPPPPSPTSSSSSTLTLSTNAEKCPHKPPCQMLTNKNSKKKGNKCKMKVDKSGCIVIDSIQYKNHQHHNHWCHICVCNQTLKTDGNDENRIVDKTAAELTSDVATHQHQQQQQPNNIQQPVGNTDANIVSFSNGDYNVFLMN